MSKTYLFVGSTNPVKINAVTNAASQTWPDAQVIGFETESGVPSQPRGDVETRLGASNRATFALAAGLQSYPEVTADDVVLGVGLEGGVFEETNGELWSTVWVSVVDRAGKSATANGARFAVPEIFAKAIKAGGEMGPVVEEMLGVPDVRQKHGLIGVITNNFVDRTEEYGTITKLALGIWYGYPTVSAFSQPTTV